jgi:hypothetical protein
LVSKSWKARSIVIPLSLSSLSLSSTHANLNVSPAPSFSDILAYSSMVLGSTFPSR